MDQFDLELMTKSEDTTLNVSIRTALMFAKRILNKYYELTDSSEAYRIALGTSTHHITVLSSLRLLMNVTGTRVSPSSHVQAPLLQDPAVGAGLDRHCTRSHRI